MDSRRLSEIWIPSIVGKASIKVCCLRMAHADSDPDLCGSVMLSEYKRFGSDDRFGQALLPHGFAFQSSSAKRGADSSIATS